MTEYIKNAEFLEALRIYKAEKEAGRTTSVTYRKAYNKIGLAIKLIADGLAKKPSFSGYSFADEMKSDAIENCITYLDNFKVELDMNWAVIRHIPYTTKGQILFKTTETTARNRANKLNNEYPEHHYTVEQITDGSFGSEVKSSDNESSESVRKYETHSTNGTKPKGFKYAVYQGKAKDKQKTTQEANPFGYFTQICWYAFLRRIEKEKKQSKIKSKMIKESGILDQITQEGDDSVYASTWLDTLKSYVDNQEDDKAEVDLTEDDDETEAPKKAKGLEEFVEE